MRVFEQIDFYYSLYRCYFKNKIGRKNIRYNKDELVPKTIHYCWFGGAPYSELIVKCMESWHKYLPEYELKLWNESNFDLEKYPFALQAYKKKKYAFVSDVVRLYALYNYGGIYMDTDVEVLKPIDRFLLHGAFSSYESDNLIPTALLGAKKYHPWIRYLLSWYDNRGFGRYDMITANTRIISKMTMLHYNIKLNGIPFILDNDVRIYPAEYFCPMKNVTENSYCIHHITGSWGD